MSKWKHGPLKMNFPPFLAELRSKITNNTITLTNSINLMGDQHFYLGCSGIVKNCNISEFYHFHFNFFSKYIFTIYFFLTNVTFKNFIHRIKTKYQLSMYLIFTNIFYLKKIRTLIGTV
jgi:hypothetical protein